MGATRPVDKLIIHLKVVRPCRRRSDGLRYSYKGWTATRARLDLVADLAIAGDSIAALGADLDGREIIEASGKYVLPGAIDGHIHLRTEWAGDPDLLYADTFDSGTIAAAFGGVTTIVDQVHVPAGMPLKEGLAQRLRDAEGHSVIDFGEHINLREASRERAAEIPALAGLGCPTFKLFMASDGYELPDNIIYLAMQHIAEIGGVALVHAENASMSRESLSTPEAGKVVNTLERVRD